MAIDTVRDAAVDVLLRVFEKGMFIDRALDKTLRRRRLTGRGRRFFTQLVYGTVRHKILCDHVLSKLLSQPKTQLPPGVLAVLRMGIFQSLFCNQVTHPAMVHTSVDLARKRGNAGLSRLANAVLRKAPQSMEDVKLPDRSADPDLYLSVRHSMPVWLVERWREEYGAEQAVVLCETANVQAPLSFRANTLKTSAKNLITNLAKAGCIVESRTSIPEELTVVAGGAKNFVAAKSKLFKNGHFVIQDGASMLPAHLLGPQSGERILDLCAAPGGKTTHIAQLTNDQADIVALDVNPYRLELIEENVERLHISGIRIACGDGAAAPVGGNFDRVLVDAPCSGLGTLRRNPDLKWRLQPHDLASLCEIQTRLLRSAIGLCKNDGLIVYSVCTFSFEETRDVAQSVIADGNVEPQDGPEWFDSWKVAEGQYRVLPEIEGLDGFFLMRLRKVS